MQYSIKTLEFDQLITFLTSYTKSQAVKQQISKISPNDKLEQITINHSLYKLFIQLLEFNISLPEVEFDDLYKVFKKADIIDSYLGVKDLLQVKKFLDAIKHISDGLYAIESGPLHIKNRSLSAMRDNLLHNRELYESLNISLEEPDFIRTSASINLQNIRTSIIEEEASLKSRLENLMNKLEKEDILQDRFYTVRNNRFVIPIKAELKRKVSGIIHDYSDTEKTAFIEPGNFIEAGNIIAQLKAEEKNECRKILKNLTQKVRNKLDQLQLANNTLIHYEFIRAISTWANEFQCSIPRFTNEFNLIAARHPLMERQFRSHHKKNSIVPLDFAINSSKFQTVAITGSNAGGKTVVLKTLGLLTLMAQSGLPVPCNENSTFILCNNILADIGDSQSIVHNLSTFSAHLAKIKEFFATLANTKRKTPRSLILIDEIGSGTDPLEGGALACAILEKLSSLATLTVASTHLGSVKTYVSDSNHMINAAMLFNTETFTPEFKLHIGRPGASHALNLARKMQLPFDLLENAEKMMDSDQLRLESMLATLEEDQRNFYRDAEKLQRDKQETLDAKQKVNTQLEALRRERKQIMHEAYREASLMIQNTRKQMKSIVAKTKESSSISSESSSLLKEKEEKVAKAMANTEAKPAAPITADRLKPNMTVWVEKLQSRAKIISVVSQDKVRIDLNGLPFEVPVKQIGRIIADIHPENRSKIIPTSKPRASKASTEINLLGLRVHQAMNQLERAIDQAMLANLHELRVIHGFGSGALRSNIQEYLNRMNISYRDGEHDKGEGGAATTIITL